MGRIKKEKGVKEDEARVEASLAKSKGTLNPETFIRLHKGALERDQKITDAKTKEELLKMREMEETSVHKKASRDDQVFARLYTKKANNELDTTNSSTILTPKKASRKNSMDMLNSPDGSRFSSWSNNTGMTPDHRSPSRLSTNIRMMGDEDVSEGVKDARRPSTDSHASGMKQRDGEDGQKLSTSLDYGMPDSKLVLPMQPRRTRGSANTTPQKSPRNAAFPSIMGRGNS